MQTTRKPWATFFMELAHSYADQSTCVSGRKVGVTIVRENRQIGAGFNGVPSGWKHPTVCARAITGVPSGGGLDLCPCLHAEPNALEFARENNVDVTGADMYVTSQPCEICAEKIAAAGMGRVFYDVAYPGSNSIQLLGSYGITCEPYHNEVMRQLPNMDSVCDYVVGLGSELRGIEKLTAFIKHLEDGHAAYDFINVLAKKLFAGHVITLTYDCGTLFVGDYPPIKLRPSPSPIDGLVIPNKPIKLLGVTP